MLNLAHHIGWNYLKKAHMESWQNPEGVDSKWTLIGSVNRELMFYGGVLIGCYLLFIIKIRGLGNVSISHVHSETLSPLWGNTVELRDTSFPSVRLSKVAVSAGCLLLFTFYTQKPGKHWNRYTEISPPSPYGRDWVRISGIYEWTLNNGQTVNIERDNAIYGLIVV